MRRKILIALCLSAGANAQTYYGNGYTIVEGAETPTMDLHTRVFKTINAANVGEGLSHLLQGSGWELARTGNTDPALWRLFQQPYPDFKRTLSPMPLGQALQYIAGDAWDLVVDPVNRLISFEVNEHYLTRIKPLPIIEPVPEPVVATPANYSTPVVYQDTPKTPTLAERRMAAALTEAGRAKPVAPVAGAVKSASATEAAGNGYDMGSFLKNVQKLRGHK